eukprot:768369-Hanusia_phi.AAC.3
MRLDRLANLKRSDGVGSFEYGDSEIRKRRPVLLDVFASLADVLRQHSILAELARHRPQLAMHGVTQRGLGAKRRG